MIDCWLTKTTGWLIWLGLITACGHRPMQAALPERLPMPLTNHAVAYLHIDGQDQYYSFNGLRSGKSYHDISNQAHLWQAGRWQRLTTPAEQLPVLASVAVAVDESVYLFGGYTVAVDHSEQSVPNVWRISGHDQQWTALPPMPTPVDDAVALVYQSRYVYLISGWHDVDNVDLVQVFDVQTHTWQQATAWPLPPVFGHAGGIVDNQMVVCDGVKVRWSGDNKTFLPSPACAQGSINPQDPTEIHWQAIKHHSGVAYYRMAASSDAEAQIFFVAGSDNPYNYDGIGYNGVPAEPSSAMRLYDINTRQWTTKQDMIPASMDHRSLIRTPHGYVIMGGMGPNQVVLDHITTIKTSDLANKQQP